MSNLSHLAGEVREVGENVFSNSQDLFLLLNINTSDDVEVRRKLKHGLNTVETILSLLTYLSTLELDMLDRHEDLMNEMNKIEYSCQELQRVLSKIIESGKLHSYGRKYIDKLITAVKNSANKIITISYLHDKKYGQKNNVQSCSDESEDICYEDRQTCEHYCPNGYCVEENVEIRKHDSNCPDNTETFTESTWTHAENGHEGDEFMPWHVNTQNIKSITVENERYTLWDLIKRGSFRGNQILDIKNLYLNQRHSPVDGVTDSEKLSFEQTSVTDSFSANDSFAENIESGTYEHGSDILNHEPEHKNNNEFSANNDEFNINEPKLQDSTSQNLDLDNPSFATEEPTVAYTESTTTETYYTTEYSSETTTYVYSEEYTTEPTTQSYETTTQDMYKLSQDVYQAAQDLSSKSSEISSMSSEISSKSSDISSMVSELNNYEDEELSKKIQGITKLTQEINSKTSEISSLTSTMSSLASDISSASSDMPSADRHHAFRTTPWQKMASKGDELVTAAQGVVTAAQDILVKVTEVVTSTADLKVATPVANMAGQMTAKTQRLISEALSVVSKVIELMSVIDS